MIADLVTAPDDIGGERWRFLHFPTCEKECRLDVLSIQQVQDVARIAKCGAIIESERHEGLARLHPRHDRSKQLIATRLAQLEQPKH